MGCGDGNPCVASVDDVGALLLSTTPGPAAQTPVPKEMTPIPEVTILPTAIPTSWPTPQFSNTRAVSALTINNSYNVDVQCDYGVSTPAPFTVPSGTIYTDNFGARGEKMSSHVRCARVANTPNTGSLKIFGDN